MKTVDVVASLAVHAAVIGVGVYALSPAPRDTSAVEPEPIYFEIVEAAAQEEASRPSAKPQEQAQRPVDTPDIPVPMEPIEPPKFLEPIAPQDHLDNLPPLEFPVSPEEPEPPMPLLDSRSVKPLEWLPAPPDEEEHAQVAAVPQALNRIVPTYPRAARRRGHEGYVEVEIVVTEDGAVTEAHVVTSSGHAELDKAALEAVRTARFAPATENGLAVRGRLRLTFDFRLK